MLQTFNPENKKFVKSRDVKFVKVRETKEKEGIVEELSNEPFQRIIKVEHFGDSEDSSSGSENESEKKMGDLANQRSLSIKQNSFGST